MNEIERSPVGYTCVYHQTVSTKPSRQGPGRSGTQSEWAFVRSKLLLNQLVTIMPTRTPNCSVI